MKEHAFEYLNNIFLTIQY